MAYAKRDGIEVADELAIFLEEEALPPIALEPRMFWAGFAALIRMFAPRNAALLARREELQSKIDAFHQRCRARGAAPTPEEHKAFLLDIGYLVPEGPDFEIAPGNVDPEVASIAGPQLVVPLSNTRYALNAANARWGSLYDALYGTDAIPDLGELARSERYNPARGAVVIARAKALLDEVAPLTVGSHTDATSYRVEQGALRIGDVALSDPSVFAGYCGEALAPNAILFRHHGLHVEIVLDRTSSIGKDDPTGMADLILESAITAIMDLEDSVAAVDAEDKVALYRAMLGLLRGDLTAAFERNGKTIARALNADRLYTAPDGQPLALPGRSLMLFRNVGHLMTTNAIRTRDGAEIPEGILDGVVTALLVRSNLEGKGLYRNSRTGSAYIVKPKMHGPEEVSFANALFDACEDLAGLPRHTLKIGVMDEERRTSTNLKECIRAVKDRIIFINTGFLDRTGDEIHTGMHAGPFVRKGAMRGEAWFNAYEDRNVAVGLAAGFAGRAQIGKGMWAMPDRMAAMLETKAAHPRAGASAAWVPSPTAATLHALHYHAVDVAARQRELMGARIPPVELLLSMPLGSPSGWSEADVRAELELNCQSILGYVVRWIDSGIGCSKVPDIHDVGLMEDRATLRISSQALANWLLHGVCTSDEVKDALRCMAERVDAQNASDPHYRPMCADLKQSIAFNASCDLVFKGAEQPNGYTEPLLHAHRRQAKAGASRI